MRPCERRTEALVAELVHVARGGALGHEAAHPLDAAAAEERLVEVADLVGEVDVGAVGHEGCGLLGAGGPDADELHGISS